MMNLSKKLLLPIVLFAMITMGFGQSGEIKIRFMGNCGLHLSDGKSDFYIDFPYKSGAHNYMVYDKAEIARLKPNAIYIFTHRHADHYSDKILRNLTGQKFDPWNIAELEKTGNTIPNFDIKAFETPHKVFGVSFRHYSYAITWHNKKIFISGDTENADTMAAQKDLDWAFVPAWIFSDAKLKGIKLKELSKRFAVYHIGPKDRITTDGTDSQIMLLNKQGEVITIPY